MGFFYGVGALTVIPAVQPPSVYSVPGLLRLRFASDVQIDRARVVIGGCIVRYDRSFGLVSDGTCALSRADHSTIGNDVTLMLAFRSPVSGMLRAEQTPQGGVSSGLLDVGVVALP
jgi:hypothetical protein